MPIKPVFRVNPTSSSFPRFLNPWSGEDAGTGLGGSAPPYAFSNGRAITVVAGTIARATVPGATGLRIEAIDGDATGTGEQGTVTGSAVDLGAAATSVNGTIGGTWPAATTADLTDANCIGFSSITSTTTSDDNNIGILFEDAADNSIDYHGFGDREANIMSGAGTNDRFTTFGVSDAVASTESFVQTPWPVMGTFQYVSMVYAVGTGTGDVTLVMRVNGADSAITFTLSDSSGAKVFVHNEALSVMVNAEDLISWRINNASGTANFRCTLMCGFIRG